MPPLLTRSRKIKDISGGAKRRRGWGLDAAAILLAAPSFLLFVPLPATAVWWVAIRSAPWQLERAGPTTALPAAPRASSFS